MRYDLFGFGGNVGSESYVTDQGIPAPSGRGVVNLAIFCYAVGALDAYLELMGAVKAGKVSRQKNLKLKIIVVSLGWPLIYLAGVVEVLNIF